MNICTLWNNIVYRNYDFEPFRWVMAPRQISEVPNFGLSNFVVSSKLPNCLNMFDYLVDLTSLVIGEPSIFPGNWGAKKQQKEFPNHMIVDMRLSQNGSQQHTQLHNSILAVFRGNTGLWMKWGPNLEATQDDPHKNMVG